MSTETDNRIEVRLRDPSQLYNSMDPSPFSDRDLDDAAEEFIVNWARELPHKTELELIIRLVPFPGHARKPRLADLGAHA